MSVDTWVPQHALVVSVPSAWTGRHGEDVPSGTECSQDRVTTARHAVVDNMNPLSTIGGNGMDWRTAAEWIVRIARAITLSFFLGPPDGCLASREPEAPTSG